MTFPKGYKPPKDYKPPIGIVPWRERRLRCKLGIHSDPDPGRRFRGTLAEQATRVANPEGWYCKLCGEFVQGAGPM